MIQLLKEIVECQQKIYALEQKLKDKSYWINKAEKEAGFVPEGEKDWVHVEVTKFKIEVSVCHDKYSGSKHWINGQWFDTSFPKTYPDNTELLKL